MSFETTPERKISQLSFTVQQIRDDFNLVNRDPIFKIEHIDDNILKLEGIKRGTSDYDFIIPFRLDGFPYSPIVKISADWTIDLATNGIDLENSIGGIVDGLGRLQGNYLIWAFLDPVLGFAGIGCTQKPQTSFTEISTGTAGKGDTRLFTVPEARKFTVGARVVVRNEEGVDPQDFEWNWAVVVNINSSITITLKMDNNSDYGVPITSVAGGDILQWNMFRPTISTALPQVLYQNNYMLLGEIDQHVGTTQIHFFNKKTDTHRQNGVLVFSTNNNIGKTTLHFGRVIPLWTKLVTFRQNSIGGAVGNAVFITSNDFGEAWFEGKRASSATENSRNVGAIPLDRNARLAINKPNNMTARVILLTYILPEGGMEE